MYIIIVKVSVLFAMILVDSPFVSHALKHASLSSSASSQSTRHTCTTRPSFNGIDQQTQDDFAFSVQTDGDNRHPITSDNFTWGGMVTHRWEHVCWGLYCLYDFFNVSLLFLCIQKGATWQVVYFPYGSNGSRQYVSVYLHLIDGKLVNDRLRFKITLRGTNPSDTVISERLSKPHNFDMVISKHQIYE